MKQQTQLLCLVYSIVLVFLCCRANAQITCKINTVLGCFEDFTNAQRALPYTASDGAGTMTQEVCASLCYRKNYTIAGVEFAYQCFCGNSFNYQIQHPMSDCSTPCSGNPNEQCGGGNRLLAYTFSCTGTSPPNGYACLDAASKALPFCNIALSIPDRVKDLVGRLTLDEKLGLLGPDTKHTTVDPCTCMAADVSRLGIPPYLQLVEINSAISSACVAPNKCATEFPGPTLLAASFNRTVWHAKGTYLSDEMRAFNNINWFRGFNEPNDLIGLIGYGPNINIVRDPRFGRNSELPSEDPFQSGSYAVEFVQGMQVGPDPKYFKMIAGLKHYTCYSVENGRGYRIFNVSQFDLWDTYLVQYKMGFDPQQGNAQAVMCAYSGVNGVPMCANNYLQNQVLRKTWGRDDVLIVSDCGAIGNMVSQNHYATNNADAAAKTLNGGCDLNLGDSFFPPVVDGGNGALPTAIQTGQTDVAHVDAAVTRALSKRFLTGAFDPIANQVYTKIGADVINSTQHWDFVLDSALQGLILLKNSKNTLPFGPGKKLAVVGPHIYSQRDLMESYKGMASLHHYHPALIDTEVPGHCGDEECYGEGDQRFPCIRTIAEVFTTMHGAANTKVAQGVALDSQDASGIPAAMDIVNAADQVVLTLGIGNTQEHEGIDRTNTILPGLQEKFALQVLAAGKPTVIVLINGGILSIDNLVAPAPAIIEAFYPAFRTGEALFRAIYGQANRWGKLPVTVYPANYINQVDMYSFDMTKAPGRTYRYYTGNPLWSFGYGLSYTTFKYTCTGRSVSGSIQISCTLSNNGTVIGDEVLQVYHRAGVDVRAAAKHPVPIRSLVDFERYTIPVAGTVAANFNIPTSKLVLTDNSGNKILYPGTHYLDVTNGVNPSSTITYVVSTQEIIEEAPENHDL